MPLTGSPSLISVGRLAPVKRLQDLIQAIAGPGLDQAALHLVGMGGERARLERLAMDLGVADRVIFHGGCDDQVATGLVLGADVFVLPSEREGGPTAVIEALMLGCPVVASDIPGTRAILDQVGTGKLVPVGDVDAWRRVLAERQEAVSPEVQQRLVECYGWEARAPEILTLYRQSLSGRN